MQKGGLTGKAFVYSTANSKEYYLYGRRLEDKKYKVYQCMVIDLYEYSYGRSVSVHANVLLGERRSKECKSISLDEFFKVYNKAMSYLNKASDKN